MEVDTTCMVSSVAIVVGSRPCVWSTLEALVNRQNSNVHCGACKYMYPCRSDVHCDSMLGTFLASIARFIDPMWTYLLGRQQWANKHVTVICQSGCSCMRAPEDGISRLILDRWAIPPTHLALSSEPCCTRVNPQRIILGS